MSDMPEQTSDTYIDSTSIVDAGAVIGHGCRIWHFCHVMGGATIGDGCTLGQNVMKADGVSLGRNVKVQNNVSVYSGVTVEDNVFLGPSCVFTNVRNPRSEICRRGQYERTLVREGATIGGNATIRCGVTIGRYGFVGAGSVVTADVPDYAVVTGVPARHSGWMSRYGALLEFDSTGMAVCSESGLRYRNENGTVYEESEANGDI